VCKSRISPLAPSHLRNNRRLWLRLKLRLWWPRLLSTAWGTTTARAKLLLGVRGIRPGATVCFSEGASG